MGGWQGARTQGRGQTDAHGAHRAPLAPGFEVHGRASKRLCRNCAVRHKRREGRADPGSGTNRGPRSADRAPETQTKGPRPRVHRTGPRPHLLSWSTLTLHVLPEHRLVQGLRDPRQASARHAAKPGPGVASRRGTDIRSIPRAIAAAQWLCKHARQFH